MQRTFFIILFLLAFQPILSANSNSFVLDDYSVGLEFKSKEDVNKDLRTMLDLTPLKPISLPEGFSLNFDLKLLNAISSYGYVFRLIVNDAESLDLISCIGENKMTVVLNDGGHVKYKGDIQIDRNTDKDKWKEVAITVNEDRINCIIDSKEITISSSFKKLGDTHFLFGANNHSSFYTTDVSPMVIKNIRIENGEGVLIRNWELSQHNDNISYDTVKKYPAKETNGVWEIDKHLKWRLWHEFVFPDKNSPALAVDSIRNRVYISTTNALYTLDIESRIVDSIPNQQAYNHLYYDYAKNTLMAYNAVDNKLSAFDFEQKNWTSGVLNDNIDISHHNKVFDSHNNQFVVFGGYGQYTYKSVLSKYNVADSSWQHVDLKDKIAPRYLASASLGEDGKMLLFGGVGSISGRQEDSPGNMYDLFWIDLKSNHVESLGKLNGIGEHYAFSNSLVINKAKNKFYTLAYYNNKHKSSIRLMEVDMSDMQCRFSTDTIPFIFQDTESYCDLFSYYDSYLQQTFLYAIVMQKDGEGIFSLRTYFLRYPPLMNILDTKQDVAKGLSSSIIISVSLLVLFVLFALFLGVKWRRRKQSDLIDQEYNGNSELVVESENIAIGKLSIHLLGEFTVYNREGENITSSFSGIIKQMFLFCLLEKVFHNKGVTSEQLEELFWSNMEKTKATNNRNVNINKLRALLAGLGDTSFVKEDIYWQMTFGEDIYCDLIEVVTLLKQTDTENKAYLSRLITITSKGRLLEKFDSDWADDFKSLYSSMCMECMMTLLQTSQSQKDFSLMVSLCNIMLIHDSLDEKAITLKCQYLYKMGRKGLSKQCYEKFCRDYVFLLNDTPKLSFEEIIGSN